MGYHKRKITKGILGLSSKIQEELEELQDAEAQGNRILSICELADLYGALKACAKTYGFSMGDLETMSSATESSFEEGER